MISVRTRNQVAAVAALQFVVGLIVGALFLLVLSPLGVGRLVRHAATRTRRALKPVLLWINAWQFKQSEDDIEYFASFRLHLHAQEHVRRVRQRKLQQQRERINQW